MQDNILVFGKNGQIASELNLILKDARFAGSLECNFENKDNVENFLENLNIKPDIIINASAYTNVDLAEDEKEKCLKINFEAVKTISEFCKRNNIILIHYSTDYIFDGNGEDAFLENNTENLNPLNYYGETKLLAENYIRSLDFSFYIIRTSWVYSRFGNNFVKKITQLLKEKEELSIINDQFGSPTWARNIAEITLEFIKRRPPFGIYHLTDDGFTNWYQFAFEIKENLIKKGEKLLNKNLKEISSQFYKTKAKRGRNSKLSKDKIKNNLNIKLKNWKDSLSEFILNEN